MLGVQTRRGLLSLPPSCLPLPMRTLLPSRCWTDMTPSMLWSLTADGINEGTVTICTLIASMSGAGGSCAGAGSMTT